MSSITLFVDSLTNKLNFHCLGIIQPNFMTTNQKKSIYTEQQTGEVNNADQWCGETLHLVFTWMLFNTYFMLHELQLDVQLTDNFGILLAASNCIYELFKDPTLEAG